MHIKTILKDKSADVFSGTFICVIIIMVAFTLMSLTFLVNTHYKVTREMEHTLNLIATEQAKDDYDFLASSSSYGIYEYFDTERYINSLKENPTFEYNENDGSFEGKGFKVSNINIEAEIPEEQKQLTPWGSVTDDYDFNSGFDVHFTVTAKIDYTANLILSDKPVKITTGDIKFTSSYEYLNDINSFQNQGENNDFSKYQDK